MTLQWLMYALRFSLLSLCFAFFFLCPCPLWAGYRTTQGLAVLWGTFIAIIFSTQRLKEEYWQAFMAFVIIFGVCRFFHTIIYARALPHMIRSAFYAMGVMAILGAALLAVIAVFKD